MVVNTKNLDLEIRPSHLVVLRSDLNKLFFLTMRQIFKNRALDAQDTLTYIVWYEIC